MLYYFATGTLCAYAGEIVALVQQRMELDAEARTVWGEKGEGEKVDVWVMAWEEDVVKAVVGSVLGAFVVLGTLEPVRTKVSI